jgi:hypothetical protein
MSFISNESSKNTIPSFTSQIQAFKIILGTEHGVGYACNASTQEAEAEAGRFQVEGPPRPETKFNAS